VRERLAWRDITVKAEECRPHRVVEPAVGDDHIEDRLRRDLVPDADGLKQPTRRRDDGGRPRITRCTAERGIGHRDRKRLPEPLAQRDGEREAGEAAPADQHIDALPGLLGHLFHLCLLGPSYHCHAGPRRVI
jgi:hypothetical protein